MSIDEQNLSAAPTDAQNTKWFALARKQSGVAQRILMNVSVTTEEGLADPRLLSILLLVRALNNFQGALLMAQHQLIVEARTLMRSLLETTFCLGALKNDPDFRRMLFHDEITNRRGRAKFILKNPDILRSLASESAKQLALNVEQLDTWGKLSHLQIADMARKAGLGHTYLAYRQLSADAAHPTVTSLNRYVVPATDPSSRAFRWGTDCDPVEITDTISFGCAIFMASCIAMNEMLRDKEINTSLCECVKEYEALMKAHDTGESRSGASVMHSPSRQRGSRPNSR